MLWSDGQFRLPGEAYFHQRHYVRHPVTRVGPPTYRQSSCLW
jgi:hypothetical protein